MSEDEDLPTRFSRAQASEVARTGADEEAFEAMVAMFEWVQGRKPLDDLEAYVWGSKNSDANLSAFGFDGRAGFQYCYDCVLAVEQARADRHGRHEQHTAYHRARASVPRALWLAAALEMDAVSVEREQENWEREDQRHEEHTDAMPPFVRQLVP